MSNAKGPKVLVIDDEQEILGLLRMGLESLGYQVTTASDGRKGVDAFVKGKFDIVLCDMVMPELTGAEVLARIIEIDDEMPVLIVTGHPEIDTAVQAMAQGAYDYVTKPFSITDLDHRIRRSLEAKAAHERAKSARALSLVLILSIPFWIILGLVLALLFR